MIRFDSNSNGADAVLRIDLISECDKVHAKFSCNHCGLRIDLISECDKVDDEVTLLEARKYACFSAIKPRGRSEK